MLGLAGIDAAEAAIGAASLALGWVVVIVLWWLMVGRPTRDERRERAARDHPEQADARGGRERPS